jgi:hypothetical protein
VSLGLGVLLKDGVLWNLLESAIWYFEAGIALCSDTHDALAICGAETACDGPDVRTIVMLEPHGR